MGYGVFEELEKLKKKQEAARSKYGNTTKQTVTPVPEDTDYGVFNELRKIQQKQEETRNALATKPKLGGAGGSIFDDEDIGPVKEEEEERTWFQKGAFEDGFSLKNTAKAIIGSAEDVIENVGTGIAGMGEKLVDTFVQLAPFYSQSQFYQNGGSFLSVDMQEKQNQAFEQGKKSAAEFVKKDLYDEEKLVKQIYSNNTISKRLLGENPDDLSVFGEKSDSLAQSAGQLVATAGLQAVGVPWYLTTGITSYGGEVENALKQGATMEEAGVSGLITAGAEILTEKISGGIKFGGKTLDEKLVKEIARGVSNKTIRTLTKLGFDAAGEGFEEVLSGAISAVGQKITYADDKELNELFSKEDAWDSFIGGAVLGGGSSVIGAVKAKKNGVDFASGLTNNEQKVVDKEYNDRVAEAEKKGKVSQSEKSKIYDRVLEDMEKGYISTDSIEAALGGDTYNNYRSTTAYEENILKEFEELGKKQNPTLSETHRYNELVQQVKAIKEKKAGEQLKTKLGENVRNLVAGDRLIESYNEIERKKQAFEADLSQYDEKQKATVKAAMESGVLNNSNRSHDLVDLAAKVSSDTGVPVKFSDTQKIKEAGLYPKHTVDLKADGTKTEYDLGIKNLDENFKPAVKVGGVEVDKYKVDFKNGKITFESAPTGDVSVTVEGTEIVNAVYTKDGIVLNVKSPKYLETLTGHEITHAFEKMNNYENLKNVLKSISEDKGDWETRLKDKQAKYKGIENADAEREVIADLVGEYIFEGSDYIMELSAKDRNVFEKFIDGIKHMLKMVTAGSQEARRLEQAKREFEKVYRELAAKNSANGGTQYNIDRTKSMTWAEQIQGALYNGKNIRRNDTLVVGRPAETSVANEIDDKPLAIPLSVMTKASSGKDISHSIKKGKLAKLDEGIKNAPITIVNPERNSVVYVTDIKQGGLPVITAFEMNTTFDGDEVHKATSIHLQVDTEAMLKNLPETATVYVRKNELDPVGATNNLRGLAAKIKFIEGTVAQDKQDVKKQFSLSNPVEETKELMAIHNLTGEKLLKSLKMGGLPMPSIAIAKAKDGHGEFGEISLVLNKDTIDPQVSSRNKLYSGDAWTPTYPSVDYKPSEKVLNKVKDKISGLVPYEVRNVLGSVLFDTDNASTYLSRYNGNMVEAYKQNDTMKFAYLKDTGSDITLPTKEEDLYYYGGVSNEAVRYFSGKLVGGLQAVERFRNMSGRDLVQEKALTEAVADAQNFDVLRTLEPGSDEYRAYEENPVFRAEDVSYRDIDSMLSAARKLLKNGVQQTVDRKAAKELISGEVDQAAYEKWLEDLFAGVVEKEGLRNNKDYFTPSGNRRSFEALHYEHNLENVVKAMREQGEKGIGNGFGGASIFGAATTEFSSIDEMKRWSDRLQTMSYDEYQELRKSFTDRFLEIAMRLPNEKNSFTATDSAAEVLTEAVAKYKTRNGIANYLRRELKGWATYSDQAVNDLIDLVDDIRRMPTGYFEAKPQRAVGFDEVAAFVIPYDADSKLKQELLNNGFNIAEYDPHVEGDRQRVLNQFEEYTFSLSDASEQTKQSGYRATLGKDVALDAPVAENATTEATVSNTESVADMFPDDTAPTQEEYEFLLAEREDIKGAMDAYAAVGNYDSAERLMAEYEAVQARIAEIEADDTDRLASLDEADAPPEMDNAPEDVADNVPLTKVLVNNLAKQVKGQLGLGNNRTAEVRELIERYSNEEFPSKAHLYTEIQDRFGKYIETEVDQDLKGVKSLLRTYGINVDESIKAEIPDYGQMMRSNFGKVRFSKEGLPVDVAYKEFQEVLPGYFPESTYVPTDQLMRIIEVANMDTTMETEYEIDWQTLEDVTDTIMNGVAEFKQNRKETLANKHGRESFQSLMESADQYVPPISWDVAPTRPIKPAIESVQSDDVAPVYETSSGQQALMPEEEAPKKLTRSELHLNIMDDIKTMFRERGFDFDEVLKKAKDLSTFATVDNTPQRVMEKALGYKEGQALSDLTVNKVAQNETEGIRWLNSFTDKKSGLLTKISKQYGIKPGSKESAAAQMYAEGFYVGENEAIIEYSDKELAADFPDAKVRDNIKKLARDPRIRQIYDETLAAINASRTRNAYPEIPRLDNYFLHFRAMEDTFSRLGLPFNPNDIRAKDLPTDLNGVTADLKPGQPYFASAKHRLGKRTSFDLLGGLEKYLTSAKNQIYHIDDIQTLRALRNYVAETYGQATGLHDLDLLSDEEAEQRIEAVYNSHLSTFAKFLNEEANVLAGKTSLIDRGLEGVIGRRGITFLDTLNKQVGANMVGFNVSSSLTNFIAPVQAFAKSNKADFVKAMAQTAYNKIGSIFGKGDGFTEESPVMIRRKGAERFYRTPYQKVADTGYVLMGVVDDISTELIARTKYNELTRKGMDSQQAHYETDKWVSRLMGDRSLGQQPQLYNSKMLGLFTKFQLEVRNQLDSQFYDTIQEAKVSTEEIENKLLRNAKKAAKITSTFAQLAVMQHLFGKAFESVAGYNPAFDIIEALIKTFGWDDEEDEEDTVLDNIEQGFLELMGDMPYVSTLTGGRIPISSALPIEELYKGEDQYGNEKSRWQTLGEAAPYYLLPGGYGQIKKTKAGMDMFDEDLPIAGSYTNSGNLRFPVEDTTGNRVQAALFGQWASENARDYFDNERKPLQEKQIQELIDSEMPIIDYWDYREGLAEYDKLEDKADYIAGLDLPISTKNMLVNNVAGRKEPIDMADYGMYGSLEEMDFATKNPEKYDVAMKVGGYAAYMGYQAGMKDMKLAEKADYISKLNLTTAQKNILINSETDRKEPIDLTGYENFSNFEEFEYAKKNPEAYAMAKTVGGYEAYTEYSDALGDIKADKDKFGNSISGSRKSKVAEYISSLDIPMTQKYILFKSEYPSADDYNYEIIDYVNNMSDMTFEEKIEVLRKLDFDVDAEGNIFW